MPPHLFTDHSLACRLERAEAVANARFVEARAGLVPDSGAEWIEVAGAYAMYDGPGSPCTQTFGLGLFQMPTRQKINELSNVLVMDLRQRDATTLVRNESLRVRIVQEDERELWALTAAEGWREFGEFADLIFDLMRVNAHGRDGTCFDGTCFLVELDGKPIATGGLAIQDGVALFAGASTVPEWRRGGRPAAFV